MKISELIKALEAMKENWGDLPVYYLAKYAGLVEVKHVLYKSEYPIGNLNIFPERIELDE